MQMLVRPPWCLLTEASSCSLADKAVQGFAIQRICVVKTMVDVRGHASAPMENLSAPVGKHVTIAQLALSDAVTNYTSS